MESPRYLRPYEDPPEANVVDSSSSFTSDYETSNEDMGEEDMYKTSSMHADDSGSNMETSVP